MLPYCSSAVCGTCRPFPSCEAQLGLACSWSSARSLFVPDKQRERRGGSTSSTCSGRLVCWLASARSSLRV